MLVHRCFRSTTHVLRGRADDKVGIGPDLDAGQQVPLQSLHLLAIPAGRYATSRIG
jgi:hypothetical protein